MKTIFIKKNELLKYVVGYITIIMIILCYEKMIPRIKYLN